MADQTTDNQGGDEEIPDKLAIMKRLESEGRWATAKSEKEMIRQQLRDKGVSKKDAVLENRLRNVLNTTTQNMYDYTCTGIFERHKLMFSFQMTIMIMEGEGELNRVELEFFLKGDVSLEGAKKGKPHAWLSDQGWKDLLKLPTLPLGEENPFTNVVETVEKQGALWKAWYDLETPETEPLPGGYHKTLTPFQRLLMYRCLRPDRVYNGVKLFVMERMGEQYVQPPVLDYNRIFQQSTPISTIVKNSPTLVVRS